MNPNSEIGRITKGRHKGALVQPCDDSMDCPRFRGANDELITICVIVSEGRDPFIVALKDTEVVWL